MIVFKRNSKGIGISVLLFLFVFFCTANLLVAQENKYELNKVQLYGAEEGFDAGAIYSLDIDKAGVVWMATDHGLYCFNGYRYFKYTLPKEELLTSKEIYCVKYINKRLLLIVKDYWGVFDIETNSINWFKLPVESFSEAEFMHYDRISVLQTKASEFWVIIPSRVLKITFDSEKKYGKAEVVKEIVDKAEKKRDYLPWFDFIGNDFFLRGFETSCSQKMNIKTGEIIAEDTRSSGLINLDHLPASACIYYTYYWFNRFGYYSQQLIQDIEWQMRTSIRCIYKAVNGDLWLGTGSGLLHIKKKNHRLEILSSNYSYRGLIQVAGDKLLASRNKEIDVFNLSYKTKEKVIPINDVQNFTILDESNIIITTLYLIYNYNYKTGDITEIYNGRPRNEIFHSVETDEKGNLWIAGTVLLKYNSDNRKLEKSALNITSQIMIFKRHGKNILAGSVDGLFIFDPEQLSIKRINTVHDFIYDIAVTEDHIYLGTKDGGLIQTDYQLNVIKKFFPGRVNKRIFSLLGTDRYLYVGALDGMYMLDLRTQIFTRLTVDEGLPANEFNYTSRTLLNEDRLAMGGISGLILMKRDMLPAIDELFKIKPAFIEYGRNNERVFSRIFDSVLNIDGETEWINLFPVNTISPRSTITFFYRIIGLDDTWQLGNAVNGIFLKSLNAGNYLLEIKAFEGAQPYRLIRLRVGQKWYKKTFFKIFIVSAGLGLVICIVLLFKSQRKLISDHSKNTLRVMQSQIEPHALMNTLINMQSLIVHNKPEEAMELISEYARYMRMILKQSSEVFSSLSDEIMLINLFLEIQKKYQGNKMSLSLENEVPSRNLQIPGLMLQPLVENAIKYGSRGTELKEGFVSINISVKGSYCYFIIINSIEQEKIENIQFESGSGSFGNKNINERIKALVSAGHIRSKFQMSIEYHEYTKEYYIKSELVVPIRTNEN